MTYLKLVNTLSYCILGICIIFCILQVSHFEPFSLGIGEHLIRTSLAKECAEHVQRGTLPAEALQCVLQFKFMGKIRFRNVINFATKSFTGNAYQHQSVSFSRNFSYLSGLDISW